MTKRLVIIVLVSLVLAVSGCNSDVEPTPTAVPTPTLTLPPTATTETEDTPPDSAIPSDILISEVLLGVPGNNQQEFIELYNTREEALNLEGWTLIYRLKDDQDEQLVIAWETGNEIPGLGHYLLAKEGQAVGAIPDAVFSLSLSERKGGLLLRAPGGDVIDRVGWGDDAPQGYFAGSPATAVRDGGSLERLPGGADGNQTNHGDNAADFIINAAPNPQNSGSPMTPFPPDTLAIRLETPDTVAPSQTFDYQLIIENLASVAAANVRVSVPVPDSFTVLDMPAGAVREAGRVQWTIPQIGLGESAAAAVTLESPAAYVDTLVRDYYAEADGLVRAYGPLRLQTMAGGSVPIAAARELPSGIITVEGVATMYTGGFYAGSTGTKFYIEDETGGVQVYVPDGIDDVHINLGDRVRVTGQLELYRNSLELIPNDYKTDIEIVATGGEPPAPLPITVKTNQTDDAVLGRLTVLEGTAVRIEEFTYSYEMDIIDDQGDTVLLYIDKLTNMSTEPFDVGKRYRVTGISEFYSGKRQLYPRIQADIAEVFLPVLLLEMGAPNNIAAGETMTVTITAVNHTAAPLANLQILANPPQGASLAEILNDGVLESGTIFWNIAELAGDGGSVTVSYRVMADAAGDGQIILAPASASADEWPAPVETNAFLTFIGEGVPIWAIQGEGPTSPYVRSEAVTSGVVTAVFPELSGFWLQDLEPDGNPATSDGLFVLAANGVDIPVMAGDQALVNGGVRELSGETTLYVAAPEAMTILGTAELPPPIAYDPPQDVAEALVYLESLEGMLVAVTEPALVTAPTTKYGETVLVYEKWGVDTVRRTDEVGFLIFTDDGSSATHLDQSTMPYALARGDRVTNLVGPLAFTFDNYKIEPVELPEMAQAERPLPTLSEAGPNQFSIATFNAENFFDNRDPNPSSPPRPSKGEYQLKLTKAAAAIVNMGAPTIVGLQEVENIGVLEQLAAQEQLAAYNYTPFLIEGTDSRGIDVGYLVRGDQATVESAEAYPAPEGLTSRPPLVIKVTVHLDSGDQTVYVLNNHFSSLAGGEAATEPRRTAQAAWNVTVMEQIQETDPAAQFVVLGDLNSFWRTLPLDTLEEAGLRHVYNWFGDDALPYTYIFQGRTQTLDHILVSDTLFNHLAAVQALHIDADYPLPTPDDPTARRVSDHDPLIAVFSFE